MGVGPAAPRDPRRWAVSRGGGGQWSGPRRHERTGCARRRSAGGRPTPRRWLRGQGLVAARSRPAARSGSQMSGSRTRVIVADDQALVRAGFRMILAAQPDIDVVAEAADGEAAVRLARRHRPDVVLMDIRMPGLDGLEATRRLRRLIRGGPVCRRCATAADRDPHDLRSGRIRLRGATGRSGRLSAQGHLTRASRQRRSNRRRRGRPACTIDHPAPGRTLRSAHDARSMPPRRRWRA